MAELYDYGICKACGQPMVYDRMSDERPHGNDEWHPECCPLCALETCCWTGCEEPAVISADGHEGDEHFLLLLCMRHWVALDEQERPWHLIKR